MTVTEAPSEKVEERRRPPHRRLLIASGALVGMGAVGVYLAGWTSVMGVNSVEVDGATSISADQLIATAGIAQGTPMMRVDLRAATSRLADLPQLASVDVRRVWPRTVVLSVTERQAVAMQRAEDGWDLIDANGIAFAVASPKPKDLPTLEKSQDEVANTAMMRALSGMSPEIRSKVASVSATSPNAIQLVMRKSDAVVFWGSADASDYKSAVLSVLLSTDAGWYDVSDPDIPTSADAVPAVVAPSPDPQASASVSPTPLPSSPSPAPATPSPVATGPAPAESAVGVVPAQD